MGICRFLRKKWVYAALGICSFEKWIYTLLPPVHCAFRPADLLCGDPTRTVSPGSPPFRNPRSTPSLCSKWTATVCAFTLMLPMVGGHALPELQRSPERAPTQISCAVPGPLRFENLQTTSFVQLYQSPAFLSDQV